MSNPAGRAPRSPERGGIAVLVAVSFTTLFALCALAIDTGYLYQSRQKMQTAADAAVVAGMRDLSGSTTTASTAATAITTACGYTSGVTVDTTTAKQLKVTINLTQQLFFGRIFGVSSKSMTVTAVGRLLSAPAIFASNPACSVTGPVAPIGLNFSGGSPGLTIDGDLQSNGGIFINNTLSGGGTQTYKSGCTCSGCPSGTTGGGSYAFPFSYTASSFACGTGSLATPGPLTVGGSPSGVYCSAGDINVTAGTIGPATATFVSATGHITFSASTVTLTAAQNGVIAYTGGTDGAGTACALPAINVGNGTVTMNGSFLAPNGCVNVNTSTLDLTGSLAGSNVGVQIGSGTISSTGGSSNYELYQ